MNKYKVAVIAVSGLKKNIFYAGDIVTEDQFPTGNAEAYVKTGHLVRVGGDVKKPEAPKVDMPSGSLKPVYDEITNGEIKAILKIRGIEFKDNAKKKDLYALL